MNVIIIEDEILSAEHLSNLLKRIDPGISVVATFDTVKKSVEQFKKGLSADLLFVDVHLADGLSFDIFTQISLDLPVIFITAYDEYAIKAFKLNSVDYLLKPVAIVDLKRSIEKYKKWSSGSQAAMLQNITTAYQNIHKQYKNRFMVKNGESIASIKTEDIAHFLCEDGSVLLATRPGKRYVIDYTLEELEDTIAGDTFFRINRKVIININSIEKVSTYFNSRLKISTEHLKDDDCVVSRERVNDFKAWLDR